MTGLIGALLLLHGALGSGPSPSSDWVIRAEHGPLSAIIRERACTPYHDQACNFDDAWACSNPWMVQALTSPVSDYYQDLFSMACVRHDGCYRHGRATYGLSRTQCDDMFYEDMKAKCAGIGTLETVLSGGMSNTACAAAALLYYRAVQNFGDSHYHANDDAKCYYDAGNENARVYLMHADGKFGDADHRYMWSKGWWVATSYFQGDRDQLLLLKPGNGAVHIHRPLTNGAVGGRIASYNWSDGWTNVRGYSVKGQGQTNSYLFILKSSNGVAQVRAVNPDGTVGSEIKAYDWSDGWTISEFYEVNQKTYLLLVKGHNLLHEQTLAPLNQHAPGGNGTMKIYQMNGDGTVGELVTQGDWSSGWSIARVFRIGKNPYLFLLKSRTGVARIYPLEHDGTIDFSAPIKYNWSSDWTTAEFANIGDETFLYLVKAKNGTAKVYKMTAEAHLGSLVRQYDWSQGWTSLAFYRVGENLFAFRNKAFVDGI